MRGRPLKYSGDRRVRPMKDRTREAVFNLLGPRIRGMYAWDLFAGTGVLGLRIDQSRRESATTLIERHIPTYRIWCRKISEALDIKSLVTLVQADAFFWMHTASLPEPFSLQDPTPPWVIFCCPPYALYQEMPEKFERLMSDLQERAPTGSLLVVEADIPYDVTQFMPGDWQVREYSPAVIGIVELERKPGSGQ